MRFIRMNRKRGTNDFHTWSNFIQKGYFICGMYGHTGYGIALLPVLRNAFDELTHLGLAYFHARHRNDSILVTTCRRVDYEYYKQRSHIVSFTQVYLYQR